MSSTSYDWTKRGLLEGKRVVVTGCSSGIGSEVSRLVQLLGGTVIGVDLNETDQFVDSFFSADMSNESSIDSLVSSLDSGIDGVVNCAGLPPTRPADMVLLVNLVGLKHFTTRVISKLNDHASIVNMASLAGIGFGDSIPAIVSSDGLGFADVSSFLSEHGITNEDGRSYFFSKEALVVWTMKNRWTWRDRNIRMNCVSPGPVETPILPDFIETLGARAEEDTQVNDRVGRPSDIAPVVCFLLSDMTHWCRGMNLAVDGGMSGHVMEKIHQF